MKQARPKTDATKKGQIRNRYKNQRMTKQMVGTTINNQWGLVLKIIFSFGKSYATSTPLDLTSSPIKVPFPSETYSSSVYLDNFPSDQVLFQ